jgi:putative flippase GtrA
VSNDGLRGLYDVHGEKLRYLVVGVGNTAIGYGVFAVTWLLVGVPLKAYAGSQVAWLSFLGTYSYIITQWLAWFVSVPISTTTMKYLAFRSKGRWAPQVIRAYFVYLPAQGIATGLLWFTVSILHVPVLLGQLITIAVTVVFSYVGHKYFTFRPDAEG